MRLLGKVAVVTGSGRGIGRTIAVQLAREGADVVVTGPNEPDLAATAQEVALAERKTLAVAADVSREEDVRALVEKARAELGPIDILVNNAAVIGPTAPLERIEQAAWDRVLAVNLTGPFLCCRAVLPAMIERRSGKIINIASVAGTQAYPLRSPYAASKWGLLGLTRTLAAEVGPFQVQVNAICPGPVEGDRMRMVIEERARTLGQTPEQVERQYKELTALAHMVSPDDVAALVAFLASPDADSITGEAIAVSAGYKL
jgi:NAD(P)-dependent dehydrogenase (short-subunit alcohol dehydrogenase family)